jgi:hypothetical protein
MTANSTISSIAYVFKHMYDKAVADEAIRLHPTIEGIPKNDDFGGDQINYSVKINNAQNITSGALSLAQAVGSASKGVQFAMKRVIKRGTISLDVEALMAAKRQPDGAFTTLVTNEVDGFVDEFMDRLGFDIFRDSTGNRGQISSISGNTLTLVTSDDARNFKVGMQVAATQNANGTSPRTGNSVVTNLDWDGGTVTLLSAASIISLGSNDFLFAAPEIGSNLEGMEMCVPLAAPLPGDSFRGVDRSQNASLLAGSRINDTGTMIEENAGKVAVKIRQAGGRSDRLTLNPQRYWEMIRRLGAKIMYSGGGGEAEYGFEKALINSPAGVLEVISDPDCPVSRGRVFLNSSHRMRTLEDFVHIANEDGLYNLRLATDDAIETRVRSMSNYQQTEPRNHGVFAI